MKLAVIFFAAGLWAGLGWEAGGSGPEIPVAASAGAPASASAPATAAASAPEKQAYYAVYTNDKATKDDDVFMLGGQSTVSVEIHEMDAPWNRAVFRLSQNQNQGQPVVEVLDADGAAMREEEMFVVHEGETVAFCVRGLQSGGEVEVKASDATGISD